MIEIAGDIQSSQVGHQDDVVEAFHPEVIAEEVQLRNVDHACGRVCEVGELDDQPFDHDVKGEGRHGQIDANDSC